MLQVNAVHVGAHHSALVEVLVGRSEKPNEPFQVKQWLFRSTTGISYLY